MIVKAYSLASTYLIMLKCPVSAANSIFCFSKASLLGVTSLCLSGVGAAPDLRDIA